MCNEANRNFGEELSGRELGVGGLRCGKFTGFVWVPMASKTSTPARKGTSGAFLYDGGSKKNAQKPEKKGGWGLWVVGRENHTWEKALGGDQRKNPERPEKKTGHQRSITKSRIRMTS